MTVNIIPTTDLNQIKLGVLAQIVCFCARGNSLKNEALALDILNNPLNDSIKHFVLTIDDEIVGYTCLKLVQVGEIVAYIGSKTCILPLYRRRRDFPSLKLANYLVDYCRNQKVDAFVGFPTTELSKLWSRVGLTVTTSSPSMSSDTSPKWCCVVSC